MLETLKNIRNESRTGFCSILNLKYRIIILTLLKLFCHFKKYDSFNGSSSISDLKYVYFLYHLGDMEKHFMCDNQGFPQKKEIIKLYLSSDDLVRSPNSMQQPLTVFLTPRWKPVAPYSFQIPSTMFRLGEVKSYVNNNLFSFHSAWIR